MVVKYRVIKYEFPTQEGLDHQLANSVPIGSHPIGRGGKMTIAELDHDPCQSGLINSQPTSDFFRSTREDRHAESN